MTGQDGLKMAGDNPVNGSLIRVSGYPYGLQTTKSHHGPFKRDLEASKICSFLTYCG